MAVEALSSGPADPEPQSPALVKPNGHAGEFTGLHVKYGAPLATYEYRDAAGESLFYVCRYEDETGTEQLCPWSYNGSQWVARAPAAPRPLYGLELLAQNPTSRVLLVDAEAIANAARHVLRPSVNLTLSWYGAHDTVDWEPLAGRVVNIWPTASDERWRTAARIGAYLYALKCEVAIIDTHGATALWSLATAIQQGMDTRAILEYARSHKRPIRTSAQAAQLAIPVHGTASAPRAELADLAAQDEEELPDGLTHSEIWSHYGLECSKGLPWPNVDNATRVIAGHPQLSRELWYDEFRGLCMRGSKQWDDEHEDIALQLWMQRSVKLAKMSVHVVRDARTNYAHTKRRHPVREQIEAMKWDGVDRVSTWVARALGVEPSPYASAVGRVWLVGMMARIYDPGCLLRTMVVLEGEQNTGKTSALSILGSPWHCEVSESMATKDFFQSLAGKWLVEISELESFGRATMERVKTAISSRSDYFRESYGRRALEHPRQCVLVGTTNADSWMADETGGTRFLPLRCGAIDLPWLLKHRTLLLAEARDRYKRGEDWHTIPREQAAAEVEQRYIADPWEEAIGAYVLGRADVSISECLGWLEVKIEMRDRRASRRVGSILRHLGWQPRTEKRDGVATKIYRPRSTTC